MSAAVPNVLARILQSTRAEVERRKQEVPLAELEARGDRRSPATQAPRASLREALRAPGIGVIAEFKRRSPSAGVLRVAADAGELARAYERGGAVALSVVTEGPHFDGSLRDLREARASSVLPILRKDFVIDAYQLHEARAAGADAVLLIVAALGAHELAQLHAEAGALGLGVLVEVHDRAELALALDAGAELLGINNRDLRDFSVDVARTSQLMAEVPGEATVVSESGIANAAQLAALEQQGVHAVLVGESLMRAPDPAAALLALRGASSGEELAASGDSKTI
ncbi:MAG: indole-3-glycerol phosphate synthase TrpC [Actinobacteria bacterium]|nr:MAG: indole-3-glycerol phosphate synthase TrpC [Actinomycetota bacterium]